MMWLVLLGLGIFAVLPFALETRRRPVRAELWAEAPGDFVRLSQGVTHYQWFGPARGPVLVAIHGLTTPSPVWHPMINGLARQGFRILVYDLYGRGYSDTGKGKQTEAYFLKQLEEMLKDQELDENVSLLGYSMGGAIAAAFAAKHTDIVQKVILVAPAGVDIHQSRVERFCRRVPVLGDWLHLLVFPSKLRTGIDESALDEQTQEMQLAQLDRRGFVPRVLSSQRHFLHTSQEEVHRTLGREAVPTLAIWGKQDGVIPIQAMGHLAQWNRAALHEVISNADHNLPLTHADDVVEHIKVMMRDSFS